MCANIRTAYRNAIKVTINRTEICEMHAAPIVIIVDIATIIIYWGSAANARSQTHQVMLGALPCFEGRSLILAPKVRQEKRYFVRVAPCILQGGR